ncbi:MAG: VOC family protein [bacterium]|nr:VOC family protein [bacterium]
MSTLATAQPARHPDPTVRARALAWVAFTRPDLAQAERFLVDFGLRVVTRTPELLVLRGTGPEAFCYLVQRGTTPRFAGFALEVGSRADLERLAALPDAGPIEALATPGGGARVRLVDPSGFAVDAVHGRARATPLPRRPALPINTPDARPRVNAGQRPPVAPPEVVRLGHVVLELADWQATCAWYTRHFGLIPSDVQVLPDGSPAVAFLRLDLGDTPADHHTLALAQGLVPRYSHSAYEVCDTDAVAMGGRVLRERGWTHAWGVGRHILGSQVFDYWEDACGDKHEHYGDGDVFTADQPMGVHAVGRDAMAQWGPPMPASFVRPPLSAGLLVDVARNLWRSPDLSLGKLVAMARGLG